MQGVSTQIAMWQRRPCALDLAVLRLRQLLHLQALIVQTEDTKAAAAVAVEMSQHRECYAAKSQHYNNPCPPRCKCILPSLKTVLLLHCCNLLFSRCSHAAAQPRPQTAS
jgi:hypothetical protein